jgi:hypothetical protein
VTQLILKRAPIGWNQDDFDVLEDGAVVGPIFLSSDAPPSRPWKWTCGHYGDIRRSAYGYEPTREAAMEAFKRNWRRETP